MSDVDVSIIVTEHGPYRIVGEVAVHDAAGVLLHHGSPAYLCRCGGSRNKPWCDATHGLKHFDGVESADHGPIAGRRDAYPATDGVTVYDDRSRCAHVGQCTARLPEVFDGAAEPFVHPAAAPPSRITDVVAGCPSGALAYARGDDPDPVEAPERPSITAVPDGPYRLRGDIAVIGADGQPYEHRARQTLCRCGQSRNKPFCDGSHWYAGFRDPVPTADVVPPRSVFEWAGGRPALERLMTRFYQQILSEPDELLEPVFRGMDPEHPLHVAAWLGETFGGPAAYTAEHGGYERMVSRHRGRGLSEEQRRRWVSRLLATADEVGLPSDPGFRSTFLAYLEWGSRIAVDNSRPGAAVIEHAPVPRWDWGQTPPFVPQPWDPADSAEKGRARHAEEHPQRDTAAPGLPGTSGTAATHIE